MSEYTQQIGSLNARAKTLLKECDDLVTKYDGQEMPTEVDAQIQAKLGEVDRLKGSLQTLQRLEINRGSFNDPEDLKAAPLSWRPASPSEGVEPVDEKSWMDIEVDSVLVHPMLGVIPTKKTIRYHPPVRLIGVKKDDYENSFEAYLRKGIQRLGPEDTKTLMVGVDTAGGFLSPPEYHAELIKKIATMATVRQNARVIQTSRDVAQWPKLNYTTDDKYTSGVRITWTGEVPASSSEHRVTDPTFGMYAIPINTAMASMPVSRDLIEDSAFDIIGISQDLLAEAYALGENDKFWNGVGAGVPKGILASVAATAGSPTADQIDVVNSLGASTITDPNDIVNLVYALASQYERNAKLYFQKATEKVIRQLQDTDGNYIWPVWPQVGNFGVAPREILGFPTVRDEFVEALGADKHPVVFGDLNGYLIADRVGMTVERLTEIYAETNIHLLLGRKRVGGQVVEPWRIKALKTVSST